MFCSFFLFSYIKLKIILNRMACIMNLTYLLIVFLAIYFFIYFHNSQILNVKHNNDNLLIFLLILNSLLNWVSVYIIAIYNINSIVAFSLGVSISVIFTFLAFHSYKTCLLLSVPYISYIFYLCI